MVDQSLEEIAAELYTLPPAEFTSARNARAKVVGDRALAAQISRLRKPLTAAWVVNVIARERADQLGQALELAAELREAQADLDAAALTALGRERRALVRSLAAEAARLAADRGEKVTPATTDAVAETLNAAMFDARAAAAVASGRLVRPLEASGAAEVDLTDAVAGGLDTDAPEPAPPTDEVAARRRRKQAERALRTAEAQVRDATRARDDLERRRKRLADRSDELATRQEKLRQELERLEREARQAQDELAEITAEHRAADAQVVDAERAVAEARAQLDD
ncbi:transposase [Microbacterium sp. MC2]